MKMTMIWSDMQFRGKDVIQLIIYAVTLSIFFLSIKADTAANMKAMENLQQQVEELKQDKQGSNKDQQALYQNMQNQINANTTQILLIKQDYEIFKQQFYNRNNGLK